jgi:hypothetical protein
VLRAGRGALANLIEDAQVSFFQCSVWDSAFRRRQ